EFAWIAADGSRACEERFSYPALRMLEIRCPVTATLFLLIVAEEEVVRAIRHENLLAHVAGHQATCRRGRSAVGVKALDKSGLGQQSAAGGSLIGADHLEQEAVNRAAIWATGFSSRSNKFLLLCPHPAAVEGTLPRHVAET